MGPTLLKILAGEIHKELRRVYGERAGATVMRGKIRVLLPGGEVDNIDAQHGRVYLGWLKEQGHAAAGAANSRLDAGGAGSIPGVSTIQEQEQEGEG